MARRRHDQLLHDPCGVFEDDAFNPENDGWFTVEDDDARVCFACAALAEWRKDTDMDKLEAGVQPHLHLMTEAQRRAARGD